MRKILELVTIISASLTNGQKTGQLGIPDDTTPNNGPGGGSTGTGDGLDDDHLKNNAIMRGIFLAVFLLSLIPLILWFVTVITDFLFHKCSKIQRKPSIQDCINILDNYLDEDTVSDLTKCGYGNPQNLFWYAQDDENDLNDVDLGNTTNDANDTRISMEQQQKKHQQQQQQPRFSNFTRTTYKTEEKVHRMLHLHKTYCYSQLEEFHSTRRYLRGNFILSLVATMKLLVTGIMVTLSLFALDTDPLTVLAFTGVAWTALWFQGGVVDLFRNYLYHFVILSMDKFHPGNIVMLEGHMKEPGCVYAITPIYTVLLIKRADATGRAEELLFEDILNYNFFVYPMTTTYKWKKPIKKNKIVASSATSNNANATIAK
jgi:hypothetical protein